jgi:hypothetical protein
MSISEDLQDALVPWLTPDLADYADAIGWMFSGVEVYVSADDEEENWSILFDPDECPVEALPYLAQYVGERLPTGLAEPLAREWIKDAPNQLRGTMYAIFRAAQRTLTGSRSVQIKERNGVLGEDDADRLSVVTYTQETPDPDAVLADLLTVVPADIVLDYQVLSGQTWDDVATAYADWTAEAAANADWATLAGHQPGANTFSRPRPL